MAMIRPAQASERGALGPTTLERLLAPLDPAIFLRDVWERDHYVVRRNDPTYYAQLMSLADVDALIGTSGILAPPQQELRLIKREHGGVTIKGGGAEAISDIHAVYRAYAAGFTINVNEVHRRWVPVATLCHGLEAIFHCGVGANLYLTPRNAQGFAPHFDTHDVFILQLAGAKTWRLYAASQPLPLADADGTVLPEPLAPPIDECVLEGGDLLYLPRGYVHEALTSGVSSLHLTVGIRVVRWADLLCDAIMLAAERDVRLREAALVGWPNGEQPLASIQDRLHKLLRRATAEVQSDAAVARAARRLAESSPPALDGHFAVLDQLGDLTLDSRVRRRAGLRCAVFREGERACLRFAGNVVRGPDYIEPDLRFVAGTESFTIDELPGELSDHGKLVLVRRLMREGLLTLEGAHR